MRTIRNITVDIRSQVFLIIALTIMWFVSIPGWISERDSKYYFWSPYLFSFRLSWSLSLVFFCSRIGGKLDHINGWSVWLYWQRLRRGFY